MKESLELIKRGIDEVLTEDDLVSKLKSKKQLTVKVGFDPLKCHLFDSSQKSFT